MPAFFYSFTATTLLGGGDTVFELIILCQLHKEKLPECIEGNDRTEQAINSNYLPSCMSGFQRGLWLQHAYGVDLMQKSNFKDYTLVKNNEKILLTDILLGAPLIM